MTYILIAFLILLASLFIFNTAGYFFRKLIQDKPVNMSHEYLLNIFYGMLIFVFIFSVFKTLGNTVNILMTLPLLLLIIKCKDEHLKIVKRSMLSWPTITATLGVLVLLFGINALRWTTNEEGFLFLSPHSDIFFYAKVSESLKEVGQENCLNIFNYFIPKLGNIPYHYFELWLISGLSYFSGLQSIYLFEFFLIVFFQVLQFLFLWGLFQKQSIKNALLCILLIFFAGVIFNYKTLLNGVQWSSQSSMFSYANIYYGVYFIFLYVAYIYRSNIFKAAAILGLLAVASFTVLPAVLGGIVLFCMYKMLQKQNMDYVLTALYTIVLFGGIMLFYFFTYTSLESVQITGTFMDNTILYPNIWDNIKQVYKATNDFILYPMLLLLPYLLFKFFTEKSLFCSDLFVFAMCIILCGLLAYVLLYNMPDSIQLYKNISIGVLATMVIIHLITASLHQYLLTIPVFFYTTFNIYQYSTSKVMHRVASPKTLELVYKTLDKESKAFTILALRNSYLIRNNNEMGGYEYAKNCLGIVTYMPKSIFPDLRSQYGTYLGEFLIKSNVYSNYSNANNMPPDRELLNFIATHSTRYIICEKDRVLPWVLQDISIPLGKDSTNGDHIYQILN